MKGKKILSVALACATACSLLAACKNTPAVPGEHTHSWGEWTVTKAPTCEAAGEERRVCKENADHVETQPVSALGHKWSAEWTKDDKSHYHVCERGCGKRSDEAEHTLRDLTCGVCGYSLAPSALTYDPIEDEGGKTVAYAVSGWAESEKDRTRLVIPASHENLPVTTVGPKAFYAAADAPDTVLKEVLLPSTVTDLGYNAFTHCQALNTIGLEKVVSVGSSAFWDTAVAEADLISATFLDDYAFYDDVALTDVTLGDGLAAFGDSAFDGTSMARLSLGKAFAMQFDEYLFPETLEEISVSAENPLYTCEGNVVYDKGISEIVFVPYAVKGSVKIAEGVTEIGYETVQFYDHAFITSLTIPSSVTAIETNFSGGAFTGCTHLAEIFNGSEIDLSETDRREKNIYGVNAWTVVRTDLNGPSILTQDEEGYVWATGEETKLVAYFGEETELTLPADHAGARYSILNYAFIASPLVKAVIPGGVREIGESSFQGSAALEEVALEEGVESIAKSAFYRCSALKRLTLPASLKSTGAGAFSFCKALEKVSYAGNVSDFAAIEFAQSLWQFTNETFTLELEGKPLSETVVIENDVAGAAFANCPIVETAILRGVKLVQQNAFIDMPNLKRVVMGKEIETFRFAFNSSKPLELYFEGNAAEWEAILSQHNNDFTAKAFTVYFYSEDPPVEEGLFWYDTDGLPQKWE